MANSSINIWDEISKELKETYPTLSKYLKTNYAHLVKDSFYKVFNSDDVKHMLWVIHMNNDVTKESLNMVNSLFLAKVKTLKQEKKQVERVEKMQKSNLNKQNMQIDKPQKPKNLIGVNRYILAWVVVLGFYILTYFLMTKAIPKESNQVVFMLFGSISTGFGTVLAYFFGSSQGSEAKTEMLKDAPPPNKTK